MTLDESGRYGTDLGRRRGQLLTVWLGGLIGLRDGSARTVSCLRIGGSRKTCRQGRVS